MTVKEFEIQHALGSMSWATKIELACNYNTPVKLLAILSNDKDWNVRCNVAKNPNTPIKALTKLSKDKDWYIRYCANITKQKRASNAGCIR